MKRRAFLKSAAAVMAAPFVPVVHLRESIDREALMRPFLGSGETSRYSLERPFRDGSLTYATDARRLIRGETDAPDVIGEARRLPMAAKCFDHYAAAAGAYHRFQPPPLSALRHAEGHDCPVCCGRRISLGENYPDFCDPIVNARIHRLGYDVDDNSIYDVDCPHCHGEPQRRRVPNVLEMNGQWFSAALLQPVFALPDLEIAATKDAMMFRSRACELEGVAMCFVSSEYLRRSDR